MHVQLSTMYPWDCTRWWRTLYPQPIGEMLGQLGPVCNIKGQNDLAMRKLGYVIIAHLLLKRGGYVSIAPPPLSNLLFRPLTVQKTMVNPNCNVLNCLRVHVNYCSREDDNLLLTLTLPSSTMTANWRPLAWTNRASVPASPTPASPLFYAQKMDSSPLILQEAPSPTDTSFRSDIK